MYRLIRFYNQNRRKILITILIITFLFVILRLLNSIEKYKVNRNMTLNTTEEKEPISKSIVSDKSAVSGEELDSKTISKETDVINDFIKYCKKNDINNAYNLVSKACKEQLFNTKEIFKEKYLDIYFYNKDILYTIENWYNTTYRINITENILSTGKEAKYSKQDYITIIEEDEDLKLSINGFIGETKINEEEEINKVKVKVESQYQYMDYTIFTLEFYNGNDTTVVLDNLDNINNIYILDRDNSKYYLYTHEITNDQLKILPHNIRKIKLKFYSKNILSKTITRIAFKNVILNYGISGYEEKTEYIIKIRN